MRSRFSGKLFHFSIAFAFVCTLHTQFAVAQQSAPGSAAQSPQTQKPDLPAPSVLPPALTANKGDYSEDFSSLTLNSSHLKLLTATLGEVDDNPLMAFTRERWQLVWRPGDPMDVYIIKPKAVKNPPVILYLYTHPQDTDRFKDDKWSALVTESGAAAVGFVSMTQGIVSSTSPQASTFSTNLTSPSSEPCMTRR
jgi:hypothetical protein